MKIIGSDGGPLIGIGRRQLGSWKGIDGCGFASAQATFSNDYDWICQVSRPRDRKPESGRVLSEGLVPVLVLTQPLETSVIESKSGNTLIAQVEYADETWSLSDITARDFDDSKIIYKKSHFDISKDEDFIFFDAALPGDLVGDNCLVVSLKSGSYDFKKGYSKSTNIGLYLFMIVPQR